MYYERNVCAQNSEVLDTDNRHKWSKLGMLWNQVTQGRNSFYSGTESIHTSVCNAATAAAATTAATTARFL